MSPKEGEGTGSFHLIDTLGALADKMLALGRGEEAERILVTSLLVVLRQVHSGQAAQLPPHVFSKSAHYAIRLADATSRARWVDYTVDLFSTLARPLPAEVAPRFTMGSMVSAMPARKRGPPRATLLLCSDGLNKHVTDEQIKPRYEAACERFLESLLHRLPFSNIVEHRLA